MCFFDVSAHIQSFLTVSDRFQSIFLSSHLSSENVFFRRFSPYSVISDRFYYVSAHIQSFLTVYNISDYPARIKDSATIRNFPPEHPATIRDGLKKHILRGQK